MPIAALTLACATAHADCSFTSTGGAINFAPLDASTPVTVTAFTTVIVKCTPAGQSPTWSFAGAYGSSPLRMKHSVLNDFMPYSMSPALVSSVGNSEIWRLTATVLGVNYQSLPLGSYSDVLVATITP